MPPRVSREGLALSGTLRSAKKTDNIPYDIACDTVITFNNLFFVRHPVILDLHFSEINPIINAIADGSLFITIFGAAGPIFFDIRVL